jgi:phosphoribosylanthranilate isomerase
MWVKICANTNLPDALLAAELGADAVGFVFAPSARRVTAAQVRSMTAELPPAVERVGVFAGSTPRQIADAVEEAGLTAVQLHGGLDVAFAEALAKELPEGVEIIHTAHWRVEDGEESAEKVQHALRTVAQTGDGARLLIDSKVGSASGGTGIAFDWAHARQTLAPPPGVRVIVAGGLQPGNVAEAIAALRPWGVDVASGVESSPGRKDAEKLRMFIKNARGS